MTKFYLVIILILTLVAFNAPAQTQHAQYPYFVIVGGFAVEANAARFTSQVHELNYPAKYVYNTQRKLYYVYMRATMDKQVARALVYRLRSERAFKDAWIYNGGFMPGAFTESDTELAEEEAESEGETIVVSASGSGAPVASASPKQVSFASPALKGQDEAETGTEAPASTPVSATESSPTKETTAEAAVKKEGKAFVFQLINSSTGNPVQGNVRIVESEKDSVFHSYKANDFAYIPAPGSGRMVVICDLLGYRYQKRAISYTNPVKSAAGITVGSSDEVIVPIKLVAAKRGDYIELERVKFFERAVIMKPESEAELTQLVNLIESNPEYKIRIHGHTHSDESAEIITLGESQHLFALDAANGHSQGSAKELSRQRAETVKAYLVSQGIDAKRITTKGLGAMLAIYEQAAANDRIEVEIVKH